MKLRAFIIVPLLTACFPSSQSVHPAPQTTPTYEQGVAAAQAQAAGLQDESASSRDAKGRPTFDPAKIRHRANTPYHCFSLVDSQGDEVGQCAVIKEWCASGVTDAKDSGLVVTSGCREASEVSCYVAYATGGMVNSSKGFCWETPEHCETMRTKSDAQMGETNVSACEQLDQSFQPA